MTKCKNNECDHIKLKDNLYCTEHSCLAGKLYDSPMEYMVDQDGIPNIGGAVMFTQYCKRFREQLGDSDIDNSWVYYNMVSNFYRWELQSV